MIKIFTEAGKGIGFGHLTRCSAIAEQLREDGEGVALNVFLKDIVLNQTEVNVLNWLDEEVEMLINSGDIVVVDSYLVSNNWLKSAKAISKKLIHLDDYNRTKYPVDLIINPNVFAQDLDYSNQLAEWVGGPDYVIVRSAFRKPKDKYTNSERTVVLITMGGSDYRNMLSKLSKWVLESGDYEVRVIVPDGKSNFYEGCKVLPLLDAEEMVNEIQHASIVISGSGQTLHELAVLNSCVIGICLDKDQVPNHKFYNEIGFIEEDLWWNDVDLKMKLKKELNRLSSPSKRASQSSKSPVLNPDGIMNVISKILKNHV